MFFCRNLGRLGLLAVASLVGFAPIACGSTQDTAMMEGGSPPDAPEAGPPPDAGDVHEPDVHPTIQVTMNGYDVSGSGTNTKETFLNAANVSPSKFGKLFTRTVDGDQFAEPLYMGSLKMSDGKTHNVVFVATEHDSVYAFDADSASESSPLWHVSLGTTTPFPSPYLAWQWSSGTSSTTPLNTCDVSAGANWVMKELGITSTPVIDPATNTIYVVAFNVDMGQTTPGGTCLNVNPKDSHYCTTYTCASPKLTYRLHALDILSGAEKFGGPVDVQAAVPGSGRGTQSGMMVFDANFNLQRASLLLANGNVYIATASFNDVGSFHGWVFAYDAATLKQTNVFLDTPNGIAGGIWQSGRGPIADSEGNVYVVSGNGTFDVNTGGTDYGDTVIQLSPDLGKVNDYFTQFVSDYMGNNFPLDWDDDFGSAGATMIPGTTMLLATGKLGIGYLIDTKSMGKFNPTGDKVVQKMRLTWRNNKTSCADEVNESWVFSTPIVWQGPDGTHLYIWGTQDYLRDYLLDGDGKFKDSGRLCFCDPWVVSGSEGQVDLPSDPNCATVHTQGTVTGGALWQGGASAVSSNGKEAGTGVLWTLYPSPGNNDSLHTYWPGTLAAYNATDISSPIWTSDLSGTRDTLGRYAKFVPPTVANGKVYAPTFSKQLVVYGLLP
jgi:hypothetical protein